MNSGGSLVLYMFRQASSRRATLGVCFCRKSTHL